MITRCPNCHSKNSLDTILAYTEAGKMLGTALRALGELEKPLAQYLGLFRPATQDLSLERANKILNELITDINRELITRNRQDYPATRATWLWALSEVLKAYENKTLIPPLKGHGYLYEVITRFKPEPVAIAYNTELKHSSQSVSASGVFRSTAPAPRARPALKGIPPEQMFSHISKNRQAGETSDECYQRLLEQEQQGDTP